MEFVRSRLVRQRFAGLLLLAALVAAGGTLVNSAIARADNGGGAPDSMALQATPIQLTFPAPSATQGPPTGTATRTATAAGRPVIEAVTAETNVRAGPDINEPRVAVISPGTQYPVVGRRFDWYQIEMPEASGGVGWVYSGVVTLIGDEAAIPNLELDQIATVDPSLQAVQQTADFVTATPGALLTLTAIGQVTPTGVFTSEGGEAATLEPGAPLPTFTPPPFTNTPIIIPQASGATSEASDDAIPPIVPILALAALGLLGLMVALLRRL
ncbi:SH3 domain-containing protein [Aggregatilinea lenta]|uniref:SH3 domain-containing protein n=1 Tax=Aggregatilinea lenta TaxID=913108 RepID=UPI0013C2AEF3|nr:SH3 domain-containing protein [Aggregatilinea lenta]